MELRESANQVDRDKTSHNPENRAAYPGKIEQLDLHKGIPGCNQHEKHSDNPVQ